MGVTEGKETSGETGIEEVSFQMFPEGSDTGAICYLKGERVPKSRCIMREGIREMFA